MANPQKEDGYVAIATEIYDAFCRYRIPGEERQVLDAVIRKTYGWHKCEDKISMGQIAEMTGLKRSNVARAIRSLLSKAILRVIKTDDRGINTLKFNKNYEEWLVSKPITVIRTDNTLLSEPITKVLSKAIHTKDNKDTITKDIYSPDFISFWNCYPNKVGKKAAYASWRKARDKPLIGDILAAVDRQKASEKWRSGYITNPATWINQGRWEDEVKTGGQSGTHQRPYKQQKPYTNLDAEVDREVDDIGRRLKESRIAKAKASSDTGDDAK